MPEYAEVHKPIGLTEYELAVQRQNEENNGLVLRLPQPVLNTVMRIILKRMRGKSLDFKLPEVHTKNKIDKTEYHFDVGAGASSVYFYRREGAAGQFPLLYFIHGGGFLGGTHLANESLMKKCCDEYDVVCASVEYHVAPGAKFPTALRECEAGLVKLLETADTARTIDRDSVYLSGDSAGGNLAAALCLLLKYERGFFPKGQILLYPVTNMLTMDTDSYRCKQPEFVAMKKGMLLSRKLYARTKNDYRDVYFSPCLSTAQDDPQPTRALLLLAGRDGLRDDGLLYGMHLRDLGADVRTVVYDKAFHAFANGLGDSLVAADMYGEVIRFMGLGGEVS